MARKASPGDLLRVPWLPLNLLGLSDLSFLEVKKISDLMLSSGSALVCSELI